MNRFRAVSCNFVTGRGVGVITGRDDLGILAWSDIGPPSPNIHVYQYNKPQDIKTMPGRNINFSKRFLAGTAYVWY